MSGRRTNQRDAAAVRRPERLEDPAMDLQGEFRGVARALVAQQEMAEAVRGLGLTIAYDPAVHDDPAYRAALRAELARRDRYRAQPGPAAATLPLLLRQDRVHAEMDVWLNEGTTPNGRIRINGEAFRLKFGSFDVALDRQYQVSTREWRDWFYEEVGLGYRGDRVAAPDDWNARASFSPLHAGGDRYCDRPAPVGNIAVWLIWTGRCLAAAVLVREQDLLEFVVTGTDLGYRCAARAP